MSPLNEEEEKKAAMEKPPWGTMVLLLVFGALFTIAWLAMYFGRFLSLGAIH